MTRPATSRLKVNPPLGHRPSLEFRRLGELAVDTGYQRSTEAGTSQALIRRIAMFWDWSLCQPLAVAKREDGRLMVVDGQHRLEAARMRGDIEDLPCVVTAYANCGDEAAAFVALNQQRRPLNAIDLFKAALAAGDVTAKAVSDLIAGAGLMLAPHSNYTAWKPGYVSNIGAIQASYRTHGERITAAALAALAAAFKGEVLQYAGTIFPGILGVITEEMRVEGRYDANRLNNALKQFSQKEWREEIGLEQAASMIGGRVAAKVAVTRAYEKASPVALVAETYRPAAKAGWCDQCDRRVDANEAAACRSPFCKAREAA